MLYRAVYVAIPICVAGVVLITQPSFLGKHSQQRSTLGILLAVGQVRTALPEVSAHIAVTLARHCSQCTDISWSMLTVQAGSSAIALN